MSVTIKIDHAHKRYGSSVIIDDLSVRIREGEFFTLLGPSGCGKTTLLRMIAGFNSIEGGDFYFNDTRINNIDPSKRRIGMVFQNYAIFPHLSVRDNVMFGLKHQPKKMSREEMLAQTEKFMQLMHIDEYADRKPERLSGGQQQRVALARALVIQPDVLLMDEPLSNLDAKLRVQLRNELKELQAKFGITTIYVTHDQEEALPLSDQIAVFNKGVIEQIGTPYEIYNNSKTEFVCNFIGDINKLEGKTITEIANQTGKKLDPAKATYIRLERIHVNEDRHEGSAQLPAKVMGREYYGLYIKYMLDVCGQTIKCIEKNDGNKYFEVGQTVTVAISPDDLMIY